MSATYTNDEMEKVVKEFGFDYYGFFDPSKLHFRSEVRDMCAAGRCKGYGKNWSCPPACGTIEEAGENASHYSKAILLQCMGEMEDDFDIEMMQETEQRLKDNFTKFVLRLSEDELDMLPMAAGTCTLCKECAYPDECRFPQKRMSSMEAYGLVVSDTCSLAGVDYYHGPQTIAFTCCLLYN